MHHMYVWGIGSDVWLLRCRSSKGAVPANHRAANMETASPLLQLPEEIWTCVVLRLLTDVRDRVSACLACRR